MRTFVKYVLTCSVLFALALSGCSSGGGGDDDTNASPVAQAADIVTDEDTPAVGTLMATDADGDPLAFSITANGALGVVTLTDATTGAFTYTPNADANGADAFSFVANDGVSDSAPATVTVTINPVNDAPVVASPLGAIDVIEGATDTVLDVSATFTDPDIAANGDTLTLTIVANSNPNLVQATLTGAALTLAYQDDQNGSAIVTLRATDVGGLSVEDSLTITVARVNDPPVIMQAPPT